MVKTLLVVLLLAGSALFLVACNGEDEEFLTDAERDELERIIGERIEAAEGEIDELRGRADEEDVRELDEIAADAREMFRQLQEAPDDRFWDIRDDLDRLLLGLERQIEDARGGLE
jgi:hypothetical protein